MVALVAMVVVAKALEMVVAVTMLCRSRHKNSPTCFTRLDVQRILHQSSSLQ